MLASVLLQPNLATTATATSPTSTLGQMSDSKIVFTAFVQDPLSGAYTTHPATVNPDGSNLKVFPPYTNGGAVPSPDGSMIAFAGIDPTFGNGSDIFVMNADGS